MTTSDKNTILSIVKKQFGKRYLGGVTWIDSHVEKMTDDFTGKEYEETVDDEVVIRLKKYPDNMLELIEDLEDKIYTQYTGVMFSFDVDD